MNDLSSTRQPNVIERTLVSISALLLLAESWYAFRNTYALIRWHVVFFHTSPFSADTWTEAISGLLLFAAACLCLVSGAYVMEKSLILALLLLPYGVWLAHSYGRSMTAVGGALLSDDLALGFLSGLGFIVIGTLMLCACLLNRRRRRLRLRAFKA